MKRAILSLFALSITAFAAERPPGFINIPWGASPEEAKRILGSRSGVVFPENTDDYHMELTGGSFAGQPVAKWVLDFPDRKFAHASVTMKLEGGASSVYKNFREELTKKYGSPTTEKRLSGGGAAVKRRTNYGEKVTSHGSSTIWKFEKNMKEKDTLFVAAELSDGKGNPVPNEDQLLVTIRYRNETLMPANTEAGKAIAPVKKEDL